jgi:RNA polymerase sigma factor (sigma-70 family)
MDALESAPDEELLALSGRQPEAFGVFYRRHENAMLVFFLRRTGDAETAADLAAEVFAAALSAADRFRPARAPAAAWLYAIANHKLASSWRRGRVEDRARRRLHMEPMVLTDDALDRVEALSDLERGTQAVQQMLDRLPPDQREAVRRHVIDEVGYAEIARELSCSTAVVRQRVSRGLKTLRTELSKGTR